MKRRSLLAVALAAALASGIALGRVWHPSSLPADDGARVASFQGGELRASAIRAALVQEPAAVRPGNPQIARRVVDDLVRARILATLAMEKGYDKDPELVQRHAEELASLYLEKELEGPERAKAPTDDDVRAFFEAHHEEFKRPERVRVAVIAFPGATPAERSAKRGRAEAALGEAKRRENEYYAFGELARKRSEDPRTAPRQGELPFMARAELTAATAPELANAAFGMAEPGKVNPAVIEAGNGLYVLKLLGREPAQDPQFEDLRDLLRTRLATERRAEHRKAFLDGVMKEADVRVDEAALEKVIAEARGARK